MKVPTFNKTNDFNVDQNFNYIQQLLQNLSFKDNVFFDIALIQDLQPTGTGGGTPVVGWNTRTLNTLKQTGEFVKLIRNEMALGVGTYFVFAYSIASASILSQLRWRNITFGVTEILGQSVDTNNGANWVLPLTGIFTVAQPSSFELQQYSNAATASGFGLAVSSTGENESYSSVLIARIG